MSLYKQLKEYEDLIDLWNRSQSLRQDDRTKERVSKMLSIFSESTGLDMTCKSCTPKNFDRVVNWFNREKEKYRLRGSKRKKK